MGRVNTAKDDVFNELDKWLAGQVWPGLWPDGEPESGNFQNATKLEVIIGEQTPRNKVLRKGFKAATVTGTRLLSSPGVPQKRHIELQLPDDMSYEAGDHLQILPSNDLSTIKRALSRFALKEDTMLTIKQASPTCPPPGDIPINTSLTALELFSGYFDLQRAANTRQIDILVDAAADEVTKQSLREVLADPKNTASMLDLMDRFPSSDLPLSLSSFLLLLATMLPRVYSFSSSPRWKPGHGTLTYNVVDQAAVGLNKGVASNYLASLEPGSTVYVSLPNKQGCSLFRLPPPELNTPVIMIGAGTGLAPFRGFIQERALSITSNKGVIKQIPPALLFFGSRGPKLDDLYREELDESESKGIVSVWRAYSQDQDNCGCRYVTDTVKNHLCEITRLWNAGSKIYVCGSKDMSGGVYSVLAPALFEVDRIGGRTNETSVDGWMRDLPQGRYVVELFN